MHPKGLFAEAAHSAGKGRFGGNVETRISPAVVSPGNTTAWGRRKKASLCHPCRQPSAPACGVPRRRNGSRAQRWQREVRRKCRNADFSGCCFARKYNCMGMPGKASLCHPCRQPSAPACGVPRRRNGSRAQLRQRQVRRECRNEDFSGCYFARKYNCMGTPEKSHCSRILFSKKRR